MSSYKAHCKIQHKIQPRSRVGIFLGQQFHLGPPTARKLNITHSVPYTTSLAACSASAAQTDTKHELSMRSNCCSSTNRRSSSTGAGTSRRLSSTEFNDRIDFGRALRRRHFFLAVAQAAATSSSLWGAPAGAAATAAGGSSPPPPPSLASFLQPLLPSPVSDLLAQLEGRAPIFQPGVAWSLQNRDRQLFYPPWLAGEWEVTARFAAASFPQGRRLLGRTVPGVLKGSMVVALPDVGAAIDAPLRYRMRFLESQQEGGVVADRWVSGHAALGLGKVGVGQ
ncbi:hypothetical protein Vretifemale_6999 [Volvox reticuliferus]|nr:hypothetical protein Vretifemale_6999 [Volvox reticuliferus]